MVLRNLPDCFGNEVSGQTFTASSLELEQTDCCEWRKLVKSWFYFRIADGMIGGMSIVLSYKMLFSFSSSWSYWQKSFSTDYQWYIQFVILLFSVPHFSSARIFRVRFLLMSHVAAWDCDLIHLKWWLWFFFQRRWFRKTINHMKKSVSIFQLALINLLSAINRWLLQLSVFRL